MTDEELLREAAVRIAENRGHTTGLKEALEMIEPPMSQRDAKRAIKARIAELEKP